MVGKGFRIGRLYGINIRVDWSWLVIVMIITWNLTTVFARLHPEWGGGLRMGLSLVAALLFFASVLAHELGHSVVARAHGLPVRNITLFLLGGVANIQREPPTPKTEFLVAAAGPVVSLLIGAAMTTVAAGNLAINGSGTGPLADRLSPASTLLFWLGSINIILALFNMIPGFPLDGGRVLRSILWAITKNLRLATRLASWIGQAVAYIMVIAGVTMIFGVSLPLLGSGMMSGLWLVFIGWFLNNASTQSYQQVALHDMLERVPVERLMQTNLPTVEPGWLVSDFIRTHGALPGGIEKEPSAFPVLHGNLLVGLVTMEDTNRVPRERWHAIPISQIMTPSPRLVTVSPEEDAASAMEKLIQRDVRQLPVVCSDNDYEFIGLLRQRDILQWLQGHLPAKHKRFSSPPPTERR